MAEADKCEKVGKDENDMKSGCEHICFIASCGRPLRGPRHNTLELYFSEIKVLYFSLSADTTMEPFSTSASAAELPLCHSRPLFCCSSLLLLLQRK